MQKPEKPVQTENAEQEMNDALDAETIHHVLKETAEDIAPAEPAVFARIEQSISRLPLPDNSTEQAESISVLRTLLNRLRDYCSRPQITWGIIATQTIVLFLFFVVFFPSKDRYQPLSSEQPHIQSPTAQTFHVTFHKNARIKEIEYLLTQLHAVIINGPGERGRYTITFLPEPPKNVEELLKTLKESPLITFIEKAY